MARLGFNTENTSKVIFVTAFIMMISSLFIPFVNLASDHKVNSHRFRILEKLKEQGIEVTNNLADLYD